jgi:hypothetical protein
MSDRRSNNRRLAPAFIASLLAMAALAWVTAKRRPFTACDVTVGDSWEFPHIRGHVYFATVDECHAAAKDAARNLPRAAIVEEDPDDKRFSLDVGLTEEGQALGRIEVRTLPLGAQHARVVVRRHSAGQPSESEVVAQIQAAMDARLIGG